MVGTLVSVTTKSKTLSTRVAKRVIGATEGRAWRGVGRKGWQRVGKRLVKGWHRVGEGLAKGWRGVSLHPPTLQFPKRPFRRAGFELQWHTMVHKIIT